MEKIIECTYCNGQASLVKENINIKYNNITYNISQLFYRCEKCKEEFTTNIIDEKTLYNLREKI